jgi:hypothetical protein
LHILAVFPAEWPDSIQISDEFLLVNLLPTRSIVTGFQSDRGNMMINANSVVALSLAAAFLAAPASAQTKEKKPPVASSLSTVEPFNTESDLLIGPVAASGAVETHTLTFANLGDAPAVVRVRALMPQNPFNDNPFDFCLDAKSGPFAVVQEMPRVALGAYETVHLDYPDSWPTPGTWLNPAGPVTEPDKPFCIVVSVDAAWPNKQPNHLVSVRWTGRVDIGE